LEKISPSLESRGGLPLPRYFRSCDLSSTGDPRAQAHDFGKHAQAVAHNMHLAPLVVIPADWHLEHAQSGALREEEQFDVEAEAIDLRLLDDRPGSFHPESLEAALGVEKGKTCR
jgi:hypothetical protein